MRGKIIEFEGLDASFKETNAKGLAEYLRKKGIKVNVVSFPRYESETSVFVKRMLNGSYGKIEPSVVHKMYALDRLDYIKMNNVESRLEQGEWFIFDRYVGSSILYQTADIANDIERQETQYEIYHYEYDRIPKPDMVIAMYSNLELIVDNISKKGKTDVFERNIKFIQKILNIYDEVIHRFDWEPIAIFKINNGFVFKSKEEILNEIIELVENKLMPSEDKECIVNNNLLRDMIKTAISRCDVNNNIDGMRDYSDLINNKGLCLGYKDNSSEEVIYPDICNSCMFFYLNDYFKNLL